MAGLKTFEECWQEVVDLHNANMQPLVQRKEEAGVIFHLLRGLQPNSYLEIGSSLGGSLMMFSQAIGRKGIYKAVDKEMHHALKLTRDKLMHLDYDVELIQADSMGRHIKFDDMYIKELIGDVVLIDGNHNYEYVKNDWEKFGQYAKKLCIFHDIECDGPARVIKDIPGHTLLSQPGGEGKMGYGLVFAG